MRRINTNFDLINFYQRVYDISDPKNTEDLAQQLEKKLESIKREDLVAEIIKQPRNISYIGLLLTMKREFDKIINSFVANGIDSPPDDGLLMALGESFFEYENQYGFYSIGAYSAYVGFLENCISRLRNLKERSC